MVVSKEIWLSLISLIVAVRMKRRIARLVSSVKYIWLLPNCSVS